MNDLPSVEKHSIVFVELPDQIKKGLTRIDKDSDSRSTLVALTPQVEHELNKLARPYRLPEAYHTEDDINEVGRQDSINLQKLSNFVDSFFHEKWDLLKETEIRPAYLNWYYLKNLINTISIRAFILKQILDAEQPSKIFYFGTQREAISRDLFFRRESCWSLVIPLVAASLGIHCESLGENSDPSSLNSYKAIRKSGYQSHLKHAIRELAGPTKMVHLRKAISAYRNIRQRFSKYLSTAESLTVAPSGLPTVLSLGRSSNVEHVLGVIESQNSLDFLRWDGPNIQKNGGYFSHGVSITQLQDHSKNIWKEIETDPKFRRFFSFWDVDCFPAVERRMQRFIEIDVPEMLQVYHRARAVLASHNPKAVLAGGMGDYSNHVIALAANKEEVPFVVYQHGSNRGYVQMESQDLAEPAEFFNERMEMVPADYMLVFGEGDVAFTARSNRGNTSVVPVGSAVLDSAKKYVANTDRKRLQDTWGLSDEKRTVLYVPPIASVNPRIAPYHSRSPSVLFHMQLKLLEVFREFPETQFIVKLHPSTQDSCSVIAQVISERGPDNCVAIMEPLTSLLPLADLFIADHPSTAFLEMLTTDRPILFCGYENPWPFCPGKWHPSVLDMWNERVEYSDDLDEFLDLLRTFINEDRFGAVESDNTLLKLFGTHLDDGKSAQRAHDFIVSLVNERAEAASV